MLDKGGINGCFTGPARQVLPVSIARMSLQIFGLAVSRGVAIGRAVLVASSRVDVDHYFIDALRTPAELDRLDAARDAVVAEFEVLKRDLPADAPTEIAALLDVHLMLLHDELLIGAAKQWITDRHYNAEWALSAQLEVLARQFDEMDDAYLRERKADLEQVVERLLKNLTASASGSPAAIRVPVNRASSPKASADSAIDACSPGVVVAMPSTSFCRQPHDVVSPLRR